MHDPDAKETHWVQPRRRALLPLDPDKFIISRSLRAAIRRNRFHITTDTAFNEVIRACARPRLDQSEMQTWLSEDIIQAFQLLHRAGHAHSIEAWLLNDSPPHASPHSVTSSLRHSPTSPPPTLVGGLYGLALGRIFCGESMFSLPSRGGTDASKVCLVHLVNHLRRRGFVLLDAQLSNDHLARFGMYEMSEHRYQKELAAHATTPVEWGPFVADVDGDEEVCR
jgi:leucyl/phenylalanyl-tRNA--protein transferase